MNLDLICNELRKGSEKLALQTANEKNLALKNVAIALDKNRQKIIDANQKDINCARENGIKESLIDRLMLDDKRINGIIDSLNIVIAQTDPIGEEVAGWKTPNGMNIRQVRVPMGVVAIIYESRPNVTVDAFCLAYKSGNAILLRGSSSAYNSNKAIVEIIKEALENTQNGVPSAIELVETDGKSHDDVQQILTAVGKIDVVLPRGGAKLIQNVVSNAKVPVIETGSGVCHLYVDEFADLEMAVNIVDNAKTQRPSVCNAIENILVHKDVAEQFYTALNEKWNGKVKIYGDEICGKFMALERPVTEEDYATEYLDYAVAVKTVASIDEAISHINRFGTKHSECIVTINHDNAVKFQKLVDAAAVYVNASTRFTDGFEFGLGAEIGISTQKLHARGPMGLQALTTYKYLVSGNGQIR